MPAKARLKIIAKTSAAKAECTRVQRIRQHPSPATPASIPSAATSTEGCRPVSPTGNGSGGSSRVAAKNAASQRPGAENTYQTTGTAHNAAAKAAAPESGSNSSADAASAPITTAETACRSGKTSASATARHLEFGSYGTRSLLLQPVSQAQPGQRQHRADQQRHGREQRQVRETGLLGDDPGIDDPQLLGAKTGGSGQIVGAAGYRLESRFGGAKVVPAAVRARSRGRQRGGLLGQIPIHRLDLALQGRFPGPRRRDFLLQIFAAVRRRETAGLSRVARAEFG